MKEEKGQEDRLLMNPEENETDKNKSDNQENNIKEKSKNGEKKEKEEKNKKEEKREDNLEEAEEIEETFKNEPEEIKIERLAGDYKTYDKSIKVMLIGDSGVGKSNILSRLINNTFTNDHIPSLSLEYSNHTIKINNFIIRMQIWDTAGQDKTNSIISNYYRSAEVAVFVYSINDINSYNSIQEWFKELINEANDENSNVKKILLGNKLDLENERQVEKYMVENFARENGFDVFQEITCKNDEEQEVFNIRNIFDAIGKIFYDEFMQSRDSYNLSSFHYLASNSILESKRNSESENKISDNCCRCSKCCLF